MCTQTLRIISNLSQEDLRNVLHEHEDKQEISWNNVLIKAETSSFSEVMALFATQVQGDEVDGVTPGDIGRALERELKLLICTDDPKYSDLRQEIDKSKESVRNIGIAISSAIAATWGLSFSIITPFVLVFILGILKLGAQAWCNGKPLEAS